MYGSRYLRPSRGLVLFKRLLWLLPALLVLSVSLALHAPARLLASAVPGGIQVAAWGGSVMSGQLAGTRQGRPLFLAWQLRGQDLLRLQAGIDLRVRGDISTDASLRRGLFGGWQLDMARLQLSSEAGAWIGQGMRLPAWQGHQLVLARAGDGRWREADGLLSTTGGALELTLQGQLQSLQLPPATLRWLQRGDDLVGELRQRDGNLPLAAVTLTAGQRIQWQLRDRLLRLKPGYASQNNPDLVVLTVSEPL